MTGRGKSARFEQAALFDKKVLGSALPMVGEQKDIRYYGTVARSVLNGTNVTKMGFWSVNPYIGCAFGCAYCYARYAHRWTAERLNAAAPIDGRAVLPTDSLPPWLA